MYTIKNAEDLFQKEGVNTGMETWRSCPFNLSPEKVKSKTSDGYG